MGVTFYPGGGSAWSPSVRMDVQPPLTRKERLAAKVRRLAERPGTVAEGNTARTILQRLEKET